MTKMKTRDLGTIIWGFLIILSHTPDTVEQSEQNGFTGMEICRSNDTACFFTRFSNLRLKRIEPVKVGHIRNLKLEPGQSYTMKTLANNPPIFEIPHFLSDDECNHIIVLANNKGLQTSSTVQESIDIDKKNLGENSESEFKVWDRDSNEFIDADEMLRGLENNVDFSPENETILEMISKSDQDGNGVIDLKEFFLRNTTAIALFIRQVKDKLPHTKSRHSKQTWFDDDKSADPIMQRIQKRVQRLTQLPMELIQASEYMQIVSYGRRGHYNCHLDSNFPTRDQECCHLIGVDMNNCRICRYLTLLYFLNDVEEGGETAFPLADNSTFDEQVWIRDENNRCNLAKSCHNSNVVAKPNKGKAIMWYNHVVDSRTGWMGALDHFSFHGGCDVRKGQKWIANNWISVGNDRRRDIWNWIDLAQQLDDVNSNNIEDLRPKDEL